MRKKLRKRERVIMTCDSFIGMELCLWGLTFVCFKNGQQGYGILLAACSLILMLVMFVYLIFVLTCKSGT